jgi:DNA polymerase III subunit alpha
MAPLPFLRSHFSLLRAAWPPEEIAATLAARAYPAGLLADWNSLAGAVRFWKAARRHGIAPMLGCEFVLRHPPREGSIILVVENDAGYRSLCRLLTASLAGLAPVTSALAGRVEGLVAVLAGHDGLLRRLLADGKGAEAARWARECRRIFGEASCFAGLSNQRPGDAGLLPQVLALAEGEGLAPLAVHEARYAEPADARLNQALASIGTLTLFDQPAPGKTLPATGFHLTPAAEWAVRLPGGGPALANAAALAARCHLALFDDLPAE